jgi:hypothetical protein
LPAKPRYTQKSRCAPAGASTAAPVLHVELLAIGLAWNAVMNAALAPAGTSSATHSAISAATIHR